MSLTLKLLCFHFFRQGGLQAGGGAVCIDKDKIENSGSQTSGQGKGDGGQVRQRHRKPISPKVGVLRVLRTSQDSSHCNFSGVHHLSWRSSLDMFQT
jgi:hypothetical protein